MFSIFKKKAPEKLWFSTDIHCHIVPGIDDGSPDASTSADLVERMQSWGIERIIASPHVTQFTFENSADTIKPALESLQHELDKRGNGIRVTNSAEYRMDDLFRERLEKKELIPYPNDWLLVENSFIQEPMGLDQLLFDIQLLGFTPILAHPERYHYYHNRIGRIKELVDRGTKMQINLLSLAGHYGKEEKKVAEQLVDAGLVSFVGTDLHNASHADSIDRYLCSSDFRKHSKALQNILNDKVFN